MGKKYGFMQKLLAPSNLIMIFDVVGKKKQHFQERPGRFFVAEIVRKRKVPICDVNYYSVYCR